MSVPSEWKQPAIRLKRDQPRIRTNFPTAVIFLGLALIGIGVGMEVHAWNSSDGWANRAAVALFGVSFALAGALFSGYALRGRRLRQRVQAEGGRAPWRFDNKWDTQGADDGSSRRVRANATALAGMILFLLPFHLFIYATEASAFKILFFLFLGAFDIGMAVLAGYILVQLSRRVVLGSNRLLFRHFPYSTGQTASLTFTGGDKFRNCQALKAVLHCIREYSEPTRNNSASNAVVESIWRQEVIFATDPCGMAELSFELPPNVPGTDLVGDPDLKPPVYWELEVTGTVSGMAYQGLFLLPIYSCGPVAETGARTLETTRLSSVARPTVPLRKISGIQAGFLCLFFFFFVVMGTLPMVQHTKRLLRNYHLVHSGMTATGRVVDYKESRGGKTRSLWPVVTYVTVAGRTVTFESAYHPNYSGYSMGCDVPVLYDPAHPEVAEINESERLWGNGVLTYLFCSIFVAIGAGGIIWVLMRRSRGDMSPPPPPGQLPYQM